MLVLLLATAARALTLQEAWNAAADHDPAVKIAREQAIQAGTLRGKAWSALSPRLDVSSAYIINNKEIVLDFSQLIPPEMQSLITVPPPTVIQLKHFWQGDLTLSDRLFSGSALPALRAAYQIDAAGQEDLRGAESDSRARVAVAYYGQLTAEGAVRVTEKGLELAQAQLALAERGKEAGLVDERAVLQGRLGVSRAQRDLESAKEGLLTAQTGLTLLLGAPGTALTLPDAFEVPPDVDASIAAARESRPDLLAARHRTLALEQQHLAQDLRWLPTIDGAGTYSYSQNSGFNDQNWNWRIVFSASWNLWDGGLRMAESRETASQVRTAELAESFGAETAEREIRLAYEAHTRAQAALDAVQTELDLAQQSLKLAEASYAAGGATWLEVEQARIVLESTELTELRERGTRDLAAIDLLVRTGKM